VVQEIPQKQSSEMVACNGLLFNHENPRRGETFATTATRGLLVAPPRVSDLLCCLYGTGKQAVDGLGLPCRRALQPEQVIGPEIASGALFLELRHDLQPRAFQFFA
jgi:hypothetical protein